MQVTVGHFLLGILAFCLECHAFFELSGKNPRNRATFNIRMGILDSFKRVVANTYSGIEFKTFNVGTYLQSCAHLVDSINSFEKDYEVLTDAALRTKTDDLKIRLQNGAVEDDVLPEAFAIVREASWRVLDLRHYDVQLLGGIVLHRGQLAEMATGEGKTLVAVLAAYLNALSGNGVFVVSSNEYLAKRDGESVGQVLKFLGLSVGIVLAEQSDSQRRSAYLCDVTYVSNQVLGFDYLKDNLVLTPDTAVLSRPFNFCIVDEADSILIDEARTPLIISRKSSGSSVKYVTAANIAKNLIPGLHYKIDPKNQKIEISASGYVFAEKIVGKPLFDLADPWAYYIVNALKAKEFLEKDKQYIVADGEISIVDSFSGRVLVGRRFSDGLQQAVEAKEGLPLSGESQTIAKISFQSLFKLFPKLSGMTGTALTDAEEFQEVYNLQVIPIPTALPIARRDNPDAVFRTKASKMKALLKNVLSIHEKRRPILIGTTSIESSAEIYQALQDIGLKCKLLNAKPENVEKENEIIAQAGRVGSITVATNLAGRGTDIPLGGSSKAYAKSVLKCLLSLKAGVLMTETAILNTGDAENVQSDDFLSLMSSMEVDLPVIPSMSTLTLLRNHVNSYVEAAKQPILKRDIEELVAELVDGVRYDANLVALRESALSLVEEFEVASSSERKQVLKLGGLYVIGSSRHESRRIDNQLRGRSGRQGDPGSTRFFLSLEDDLFRIFGGEKLAGILENFRVPEDMPIESPMVSQALDAVQSQVEDYFRGIRRQVYVLDEVTSTQRTIVYEQRQRVLTMNDDELASSFGDYCEKTLDEIVSATGLANKEKLKAKITQFFPNIDLDDAKIQLLDERTAKTYFIEQLSEAISRKKSEIYSMSSWAFGSFFRYLTLVQIDESWCKHLSRLDLMQEEMVLQSFSGEKDVVAYYRDRAEKLFSTLMDDVRRNTVYSMFIYKSK